MKNILKIYGRNILKIICLIFIIWINIEDRILILKITIRKLKIYLGLLYRVNKIIL